MNLAGPAVDAHVVEGAHAWIGLGYAFDPENDVVHIACSANLQTDGRLWPTTRLCDEYSYLVNIFTSVSPSTSEDTDISIGRRLIAHPLYPGLH